MGRLIVLLIGTVTVWGAVAFMYVASNPDWLSSAILAGVAFLSTCAIWGFGTTMDRARHEEPAQRRASEWDSSKPKRVASSGSLTSVVDSLTPEQIAALEVALQRRRELFDEDDQILAARLSAELERSTRAY